MQAAREEREEEEEEEGRLSALLERVTARTSNAACYQEGPNGAAIELEHVSRRCSACRGGEARRLCLVPMVA